MRGGGRGGYFLNSTSLPLVYIVRRDARPDKTPLYLRRFRAAGSIGVASVLKIRNKRELPSTRGVGGGGRRTKGRRGQIKSRLKIRHASRRNLWRVAPHTYARMKRERLVIVSSRSFPYPDFGYQRNRPVIIRECHSDINCIITAGATPSFPSTVKVEKRISNVFFSPPSVYR